MKKVTTIKTEKKKKEVPNVGTSVKHYNELVSAAKLNTVALRSSDFNMKPEYFEAKENNLHEMGGELGEISFAEEEGIAVAFYNWTVRARSGRKHVLSLKTEFFVLYSSLERFDKETVTAFLKNTVRYTTYPYFRNYVSTMSWISDADLPILPVITTPPHKKIVKSDSNKSK